MLKLKKATNHINKHKVTFSRPTYDSNIEDCQLRTNPKKKKKNRRRRKRRKRGMGMRNMRNGSA